MPQSTPKPPCHHCNGQGYTEIRDCAGEVQREETCVFCNGTGESEIDDHHTQTTGDTEGSVGDSSR